MDDLRKKIENLIKDRGISLASASIKIGKNSAIKRNKYKLFRYAIKHRKVYYIVKYNKLILWSLMFISAVIIYIYGMIGALI